MRSPFVPKRNRSCCSSVEIAPRPVEVDLVAVGDRLDHALVEARARRPTTARARPRRSRAHGSGTSRSGSISSCAPRPVQRGQAPCGALNEKMRGSSSGSETPCSGQAKFSLKRWLVAVDDVDADEPLGERRRRLDRLRQPLAQVGLQHEPVDDDLDRVLELLVEDDLLLEQALLAVDLDAREAVAAELLEHVAELALAVAHDRRVDGEPRPLRAARASARRSGRGSAPRSGGRRPGSAAGRRARRAAGGSRRSRSPCRPSSAGCATSSSGRSRSPARARRSSRRRASPSSGGTGARTRRATRRSGAAPRRRSCRTRGYDLPEPERPVMQIERVARQADGDVLEVVLAGAVDDELFRGHIGSRYRASIEQVFVQKLADAPHTDTVRRRGPRTSHPRLAPG